MRVSWVVADGTVLGPEVDIERFKNIGPVWGSWRTWRNCGTDNAICNDVGQARDLLRRKFNDHCNFYVPKESFVDLDRPPGVKLFDGKFTFEIDNPDEIIALHLAASQSDIILLLGFDWTEKTKIEDRLLEHRANNYRLGVEQVISDNSKTQWVLIDHPEEIRKDLTKFENLTQDSLENVLAMLDA